MLERLRWRIAYLADRLPWTCWTKLVSWALNGAVRQGLTDTHIDAMCRLDAWENDGRCYCSKICPDGDNR